MPGPFEPQPPYGDNRAADKAFRTGCLLTVLVVVVAVLVLRPVMAKQLQKAQQTRAVSSLRQIGICLFEFQEDYGSFPNEVTAAEVRQRTHTALSLSAATSNDVFTQLIVSGHARETAFDTHSRFTRRPDDVCNSDETALIHGECGFAYIAGLSLKDNPSIPVVFGAVIPGTSKLDTESFLGKGVVLKLDNSVASVPISADGKIILLGPGLLDPLSPLWNGKAPYVKWPK